MSAADGLGRMIVVATSNPHKVDEIRAVLAGLGVRVVSLADAGGAGIPEPEEDGETFAENARIKAVAYARALGATVLADDSGLEVDALQGAPGVHSARWAGRGATREERDAANNERLLRELALVPDERRGARFVCTMCLANAQGRVLAETRGEFSGVIGRNPRGSNGFGYDPLLIVGPDGLTSAEISTQEKNARSHRGAATRAMAAALARHATTM